MMGWLRLLRDGKGLRHLPIVYSERNANPVRVTLRLRNQTVIDVTHDHVPISLNPLILGIRLDELPADDTPLLEIRDSAEMLVGIRLRRAGDVPAEAARLYLFETEKCTNRCVPFLTRGVRYFLSSQHARRATHRGAGLKMSANDLICLNGYYTVARPVYIVSVSHDTCENVFPMDLVGFLSSGEFLMALRATSPAIELMQGSKRLALSAAPAVHKNAIYALAAHHRERTISVSTIPFPLAASPTYGLPIVRDAEIVREVEVRQVHRTGSHVLFVTSVIHQWGAAENQLAHVSEMYAEWLARHQRPVRQA